MTPALLLAAALQTAPAAPDLEPVLLTADLSDPDHLLSGHEGDAVWLRGASYKAFADADGFHYVPFLGSTAARNWPVTFRVERVTVGGADVPLSPPMAALEGLEATLDRGAMETRYVATPEGVEQTYVLDGLGATRGDVVVEVSLDTDLAIVRDGPGLRFDGPEGSAGLGGAVALDGLGGVLALEPELDGAALRYRIPAAFSARAGDRLVIDPLLGTLTAVDLGPDVVEPDVAYESTWDTHCIVMTTFFSASDRDVYYRTYEAATYQQVDSGFVELISGDAHQPRIAALAGADRFVATYLEGDAAGDAWIRSRARDSRAASPWETTHPVVGPSGGVEPVAHDLGGEAFDGTPTFVLAVWEERSGVSTSSEIVAQRLDVNGQLVGPQIPVAPSNPIEDYAAPAVSKYAGDPSLHNAWWIAFAGGAAGGLHDQLHVARIDFLGGVTQPAQRLFTVPGATGDLDDIDVSAPYATADVPEAIHFAGYAFAGGQRRSYLLTATRTNLPSSGPVPLLADIDIHDSVSTSGTALANSGERALIAYVDRPTPGAAASIRVSVFQRERGGGAAVGERRALVATLAPSATGRPAMVSQAAGGGSISDFFTFMVWSDAGPGGSRDILGALFASAGPDSIGRNFCPGTRNSSGQLGYLAAYGDNGTMTPKSLLATGLPPHQFGLFLVSGAFGSTFPAGSQGRLCLAGSIGRYNGSIASTGAAAELSFQMDPTAIPQGVSLVSAAAGETWGFQAWHRDANPGQTSNFTSGVQITF